MAFWKAGDELGPGQSPNPILWQQVWLGPPLPEVTDEDMRAIQGEGKGKRVYTYGHNGSRSNGRLPHFISTRTGYALHVDVGFVRFTHQVVLRNDGFQVCGLKGVADHPQGRGQVYCLDTWSPHQVVRDDRLPNHGIYKLQAAVDAEVPLTVEQVIERLTPLLSEPMAYVERATR